MVSTLNRNIFIYLFTHRRNFWPLVALLYLQIPGSEIVHLGYFLVVESCTGLLVEIPTGYLSDRFGYKCTLIVGKISLFLSTICLLVGGDLWAFLFSMVFLSIGLACKSGTIQAYVHDYLEQEDRGGEYGKIMTKIKGDVSLLSLFFIVGLPFLFSLDPLYPFYFALLVDIVGLRHSMTLKNPKSMSHAGDEIYGYVAMKHLFSVFLRSKGFLLVSLVISVFGVIILTNSNFSDAFLVDIGYPVMYIGVVMGLSRFVWFLLGRFFSSSVCSFSFKHMLVLDSLLVGGGFLSIGIFSFPWYVLGGIFSFVVGYFRARSPLYMHILIDNLPDERYKATFLSIQGQIKGLLGLVIPLGIGSIMSKSYSYGYIALGGSVILLSIIAYVISHKYLALYTNNKR